MPFVFDFDHTHAQPPMELKDLLGGKGANLAEMTSVLALPVPPGFTISTDACREYMHGGWPKSLDSEVAQARTRLEKAMGKVIGDADDPLLVSVRSGAKFSMPGMMDTVLNLGLPVPPGFTITTDACRYYLANGTAPAELGGEVTGHLEALERAMGRKLGDHADPLLVSVRSGAKFSMPGMMDTVLNIGLSDASVDGLAKQSGNERFAWDAYRRLIQMFGKTVLGIEGEAFEHALDAAKQAKDRKSVV